MLRDAGFDEVADRVWCARWSWFDVNVTAIEGERGLVVVDTHSSAPAAGEVADALRRVTDAPLVGLVNTHAHFDHVLGNGTLPGRLGARDQVPIHAHEEAVAAMRASVAREVAEHVAAGGERASEVAATQVVVPDAPLSSVRVLDLGDRQVELLHPGRGHTAGDLVVRVLDGSDPAATALCAGDLVEESADPSLGPDSHPLHWPATLDLLLELTGPRTVVVPGHGEPVDREFVADQRTDLGIVAQTIRDLAAGGVGVADALEAGEWPYPRDQLTHAVRRGYADLPRGGRRLPLA